MRYAGVDMEKDNCIYPELNHKIDTLQASLLNIRLKKIKYIQRKRIFNASLYEKYLTNSVKKPNFYRDGSHTYYTYTILTDQRSKLVNYLNKNNVETRIQHKKLLEDHYGFKNKKIPIKNKNGELLKSQVLSLPIHENLSKSEILTVINLINSFH